MVGRSTARPAQIGHQQLLPAEDIQRQETILVVETVEEPPLLLAMYRIAGGVKVQHDLLGRLLERGDELLHQHLADRPGRADPPRSPVGTA